jgi:hypothetical protein
LAHALKRCAVLLLAILAVAVAGCSQAPPTPTAAPPTAPAAAPTVVAAASPKPATSPALASPAAVASPSPIAAPSPAVKPAVSPAASPSAAAAAAPLTLQQLSDIQPGLGTIMIEYGRRMGHVWFAEQAANWDFAQYQLTEMREIQEVGETTRPARAPALKSFESQFLDPLEEQIKAKNSAQFENAYRSAIQGCNSCHGSQTSADWPQGFTFIKVQVPTKSIWDIYKWDGR